MVSDRMIIHNKGHNGTASHSLKRIPKVNDLCDLLKKTCLVKEKSEFAGGKNSIFAEATKIVATKTSAVGTKRKAMEVQEDDAASSKFQKK